MSLSSKPVLNVAPCSHEAAKFAVENWHYSRSMPAGKLFKIGAWEDDRFIGAVIFSYGANNNIGKPYGLHQTEVCELVRVALRSHAWPVSRIMRFALKMMREHSAGMRLCISYADSGQGHHGGIYQAAGWLHCGSASGTDQCADKITGKPIHARSYFAKYGTKKGAVWIAVPKRHKYLYPLDEDMKRKIEPLRKPYPKRAGSSSVERPTSGGEAGGSIPTPALNVSSV